MNTNLDTTQGLATRVFADPVAWLARFGIAAELVATTETQPLAEAA